MDIGWIDYVPLMSTFKGLGQLVKKSARAYLDYKLGVKGQAIFGQNPQPTEFSLTRSWLPVRGSIARDFLISIPLFGNIGAALFDLEAHRRIKSLQADIKSEDKAEVRKEKLVKLVKWGSAKAARKLGNEAARNTVFADSSLPSSEIAAGLKQEAKTFLKLAADWGDAEGAYGYFQEINEEKGKKEEAIRYLRRAAEKGYEEAALTFWEKKIDEEDGIKYLKKAIEHGSFEARETLAKHSGHQKP